MKFNQAGKIILDGLKKSYEHVGMLIMLNISWFFITFSPMFVMSLLRIENLVVFTSAVVLTLILLGPAAASVHYVIRQLLLKEDISVGDLKWLFPKFFGRSVLLVLMMSIILVIIGFNLVFSMNNPFIFVRLLSGVWLYFVLFWLAMLQFVFPVLISSDNGVILVLKQTALTVFDNILISLIIVVFSGIITVISLFTVIPAVLLWITLTGTIQNYALIQVIKEPKSNGIQ